MLPVTDRAIEFHSVYQNGHKVSERANYEKQLETVHPREERGNQQNIFDLAARFHVR